MSTFRCCGNHVAPGDQCDDCGRWAPCEDVVSAWPDVDDYVHVTVENGGSYTEATFRSGSQAIGQGRTHEAAVRDLFAKAGRKAAA